MKQLLTAKSVLHVDKTYAQILKRSNGKSAQSNAYNWECRSVHSEGPFSLFFGYSIRKGLIFMLIPWDAPEKQLSLQFMQTSKTAIILHLQLTKSYAFCPSCGTQSTHLHSHYSRFLFDLSSGTQHIKIHLESR